MRNILVGIWLVIDTILFYPLLVFCRVFNAHKIAFRYIQFYSRSTCFVAGAKVKTYNIERINEGKNCLVVSNHESYFDLWAVYSKVNHRVIYVAKKELGKIPIIGGWMRYSRIIFLDRDNPRQAVKDMNEAAKMLSEFPVGIFPAGTRSLEELEFKAGSFKIAKKAKAPIVPVTLVNTSSVFENRKSFKKQTVIVYVHEAIPYETYKDTDLITLASEITKLVYNKRNELAKEHNITIYD